MNRLIVFLFAGLCLSGEGAAGSVEELQSFTDFKAGDLKKLSGEDILIRRGGLMLFPRGLSSQSCFFVPASAKNTAKAIQMWDPTLHESLGVYLHKTIQSPPRESDFDSLDLNIAKSPVRWLVDKTLAVKADRFKFQISRAEAARIAEATQGRAPGAEAAGQAWKKILMSRAAGFQQNGLSKAPLYEMSDPPIKTTIEIQSLLKEEPRIAERFSRFLAEARLIGAGRAPRSRIAIQYYWELFEAEDHAALCLGASHLKAVGDHYQVIDCGYYVSNAYYTSLVLFEVWPVEGGSLVWRADLLSSSSVAAAKGIERMAFSMVMIQEIKKAIRFFQRDMRQASKG
ncbi:MAG: hypothetical protein PHV34_07795 [Verrucomicrobiae bacterium]|nr:hypothetical protein [Verrucomicrobiae bacterium]